MPTFDRRQFLAGAGALTASGFALSPAAAQTTAPAGYAGQYHDMLAAHIAGKLNALAKSWDAERARIHGAAAVEARNKVVREKFKEMIHGYPERNPLAPVTVAVHERDGYRVENVMFQSLPDFWVTGNLYVPSSGGPRYPAVISPCGHYPWSRMEPEYQCFYISMAKAGFVVMAYDPVGQGERRQYWNPRTGETEVAGASTYEHSMPGQVLLLMGEDLTHYRVWDGMRAIDYLQSRPEVDAQRIGCAGHSGGGTLSQFISALDERVKCSVVCEGGTQNRWPVDLRPDTRLGPSDVEQNIFPGARYGVDHADIHIAIAPRPLLAMIEQYHPAFNQCAAAIRQRYVELGVPEKFATEEATDPHSWTPKLRIGAVRWMSRWLNNNPGPDHEPDFPTERHETLFCTPTGSLRDAQQGETIFSLMLKKQAHLPPVHEGHAGMAREVEQLLRYRKSDVPLAPQARFTTPRKGYSIEKLEFISEPGIYIPTWVFQPPQKASSYPTLLVFNEAGKEAEGQEFGLYERLARNGRLVIACDVRGIGETRTPHAPSGDKSSTFSQLFDVETALTYMAWFADEDLLGMRVQDVVRSVDYALSRPDVDRQRLQVAGKGAGAVWVLFAAALDPRMQDVVCEHGLVSYRALAQVDRYTQPTGIFVRDVLTRLDLPQVAASLAGRKLTLASPTDPMRHPVDLDTARECYASAAAAFRTGGGQFRVIHGDPFGEA